MTLEMYLGYLIAMEIVLLIPGPTVLLVMSYGLSHGKSSTVPVVFGVTMGDICAMVCSLAGLGVVLSVSAAAFTVLKYVGAAYLIYMGIRMWRSAPQPLAQESGDLRKSSRAMAGHAFAVTALNPKSITFFVAFMPQFVSHTAPVLPQFFILGATFAVFAAVNALVYSLMAGSVRSLAARPSVLKGMQQGRGLRAHRRGPHDRRGPAICLTSENPCGNLKKSF